MTGPLYPQPAPSLGQDQNGMSAGPLGSLAPLLAGLGNELARRQEATQQILVQKGQLALEQEKHAAEEEQLKQLNKERKDKQVQFEQATAKLNADLANTQDLKSYADAVQKNIGAMMLANPTEGAKLATGLLEARKLLETQQQEEGKRTRFQAVIQANIAAHGDKIFSDPKLYGAVGAQLAAIDPKMLSEWNQAVPAPKPLEFKEQAAGGGGRSFNPNTGEIGPLIMAPPKAPTAAKPDQLNQAELGASALKQWADIEQLRTRNPQVEQQVGAILSAPTFVSAIPGMKNRGDAVQAAIKAGAKGDVLSYLRTKFGFMDSIIRTRIAGGRLSGPIWGVYAAELLPGADSGNPEANAAMRENEKQAILSAVGKSGYDENPEVWNRAAKRHGVPFSVEDFMAGTFDHKLADIQNRY